MYWNKELNRIREDSGVVTQLESAIDLLRRNRIIEFLRIIGRPSREKNSLPEFLAAEAAYSAGWYDCLDALLNFKELFLVGNNELTRMPEADYGGRRMLLERGDITEKEYNELGHTNSTGDAERGARKPAAK